MLLTEVSIRVKMLNIKLFKMYPLLSAFPDSISDFQADRIEELFTIATS